MNMKVRCDEGGKIVIYTCDCCDVIIEAPKTDKIMRCPYCGRIKHDVLQSYGIATVLAVREATDEEQKTYLDPKGYKRPDHSEDWKYHLDDPHMAAYANIDLNNMPDERLIRRFMKTGKAPTPAFAEYADKIQKAYYDFQLEMAMYDEMYFEPEEMAVGTSMFF